MGIDPMSTNKHSMRKRIEDQVNSHGNTNFAVALIPVNMRVGKKKNILWAICVGLQEAEQVTALLQTKKVPLLSFYFLDQGVNRGLPDKLATHKRTVSMTHTQQIDNLRAEMAEDFRWLFHARTNLPEQIQKEAR